MQTSILAFRGRSAGSVPPAPASQHAIILPNVRELFDRWLTARRALRTYDGSSSETAICVASAREHSARVTLVAAPAQSVEDIVAHLAGASILARGIEGIDAELESDVVASIADIRTFVLRVVSDILRLDVDIIAAKARAPEDAHV